MHSNRPQAVLLATVILVVPSAVHASDFGLVLPMLVVPVNVIGAVILFGVAAGRREGKASSFLPLAFWTTAVLVGLPSSICTLIATHYLAQGRHLGPAVGYLLSSGLFAIAVWSASRGSP